MLPNEISNHVLFTARQQIKEICAPLAMLQINGFIFMRCFPDGRIIDLGTHMEWSELFLLRFIEETYNPHAIQHHIGLASKKITLWSAHPDNQIWQEGIDSFNVGNGISLCVQHNDYKDIFCFYADANNIAMNEFYFAHLSLLRKFCDYFVEKAAKFIHQAHANNNFIRTPQKYLNILSEQQPNLNPLQFLKLIHAASPTERDDDNQIKLLTKRELECLSLVKAGSTAKMIGKHLSLSHRTVELHLLHAREKLNCVNLKELIAVVSRYSL